MCYAGLLSTAVIGGLMGAIALTPSMPHWARGIALGAVCLFGSVAGMFAWELMDRALTRKRNRHV